MRWKEYLNETEHPEGDTFDRAIFGIAMVSLELVGQLNEFTCAGKSWDPMTARSLTGKLMRNVAMLCRAHDWRLEDILVEDVKVHQADVKQLTDHE